MTPIESVAAYLVAAEDVADALAALLDECDPDQDEYPEQIAALRQFRRAGMALAGQQPLPLDRPHDR